MLAPRQIYDSANRLGRRSPLDKYLFKADKCDASPPYIQNSRSFDLTTIISREPVENHTTRTRDAERRAYEWKPDETWVPEKWQGPKPTCHPRRREADG